jgi:hypothetical protein
MPTWFDNPTLAGLEALLRQKQQGFIGRGYEPPSRVNLLLDWSTFGDESFVMSCLGPEFEIEDLSPMGWVCEEGNIPAIQAFLHATPRGDLLAFLDPDEYAFAPLWLAMSSCQDNHVVHGSPGGIILDHVTPAARRTLLARVDPSPAYYHYDSERWFGPHPPSTPLGRALHLLANCDHVGMLLAYGAPPGGVHIRERQREFHHKFQNCCQRRKARVLAALADHVPVQISLIIECYEVPSPYEAMSDTDLVTDSPIRDLYGV